LPPAPRVPVKRVVTAVPLGAQRTVQIKREELAHLKEHNPRIYFWRGLLFGMVAITVLLAGRFFLENVTTVYGWLVDAGPMGPWIYIGFLTLAILLLVPTALLKMMAGTLFGFQIGLVVNFAGSMAGGLLAFALGRWVIRERIEKAVAEDERARRLEAALGEESLRISILVRLSPLIPDEWLNYILAAGPVSLWTFNLSNLASLIYAAVYAYYGHVLGQLIFSDEALTMMQRSPEGLSLTVLGLGATVIATYLITMIAKDALQGAWSEGEEE